MVNSHFVPMQTLRKYSDKLCVFNVKTRYCNMFFLDRINTYVGFSSLDKVAASLLSYKKRNSYPYVPRVDYTELYKIINDRYLSSIDISTIGGFRR